MAGEGRQIRCRRRHLQMLMLLTTKAGVSSLGGPLARVEAGVRSENALSLPVSHSDFLDLDLGRLSLFVKVGQNSSN